MPSGEFQSQIFSRPNRRPVVSVWTVRTSSSYIVDAGQNSLTDGVFCSSIKANIPSWIGSNASGVTIGGIYRGTGLQTRFFNEASPDVAYAFANYDNGVVLNSSIKVKAFPVTTWAPDTAEFRGAYAQLESGVAYNPEAQVSITLSQDPKLAQLQYAPDPFGGPVLAAAVGLNKIQRLFNTKVGYTRASHGARPQGTYLQGSYTPHQMTAAPMEDLLDNIDDFKFVTYGDPTHELSVPLVPAYWTIIVASRPTGVITGDNVGLRVHPGIPIPHRLSIEASYRVMFYSSIGDIAAGDNNPLDAGQSMFSRARSAAESIMEGADASSFDRKRKFDD